jgi:opacity protein-like surface antigen
MMKKILLTTVFFFLSTILFAQSDLQDVVYLTNGSIIRGTIIEQVPNQSLTIETADGSLFVLAMDEIERISRERIEVPPVLEHRRFGVIGGLNGASQFVTYGRETAFTDTRIGVHLGVFMEMPMGINWTFRPELQYSMQGGVSRIGGRTYTDQLDYINVPLVFRWHFWEQRMSFDFGPQFGYMISARLTDGRNSVSVYDELNKFDFSLVVGYSVRLNDNISLGLRVTAGVTDIGEIDNHRFTNSVTQISLEISL